MSKHVSRKQRWNQDSPRQFSSQLGKVVYEQNAWYALLDYRTRLPPEGPGGLAAWEEHRARLGPFKRPRNAMVALEREVTFLQNRHGENMLLGGQVWGEAHPGGGK